MCRLVVTLTIYNIKNSLWINKFYMDDELEILLLQIQDSIFTFLSLFLVA